MLRALARGMAVIAGGTLVSLFLIACAVAAAVAVMFLACQTALVGPRGFPWNALRKLLDDPRPGRKNGEEEEAS